MPSHTHFDRICAALKWDREGGDEKRDGESETDKEGARKRGMKRERKGHADRSGPSYIKQTQTSVFTLQPDRTHTLPVFSFFPLSSHRILSFIPISLCISDTGLPTFRPSSSYFSDFLCPTNKLPSLPDLCLQYNSENIKLASFLQYCLQNTVYGSVTRYILYWIRHWNVKRVHYHLFFNLQKNHFNHLSITLKGWLDCCPSLTWPGRQLPHRIRATLSLFLV